jgi:toxin ParE1/3/4
MPKVIRSFQGDDDVFEIAAFIARENLEAALRMIELFDEKFNLLAEHPGIGQMRDELEPGLRSLPVGSYLIFYRAVPGGIEVARVLHGSRNLRRIFRRPTP